MNWRGVANRGHLSCQLQPLPINFIEAHPAHSIKSFLLRLLSTRSDELLRCLLQSLFSLISTTTSKHAHKFSLQPMVRKTVPDGLWKRGRTSYNRCKRRKIRCWLSIGQACQTCSELELECKTTIPRRRSHTRSIASCSVTKDSAVKTESKWDNQL